MKPKLLFVVNVDWFFISHRLPIAIAAQQQGYEVHVACQMTDKGQSLREHGFILHELALDRSGTSVFKELNTFLAIWSVIRRIKPDVLHAITIKPVLYSGIASRFSPVARVASISGLGFVFIAQGFKAAILRKGIGLLYRLALHRDRTKVIFQNPADKQLFVEHKIIDASQPVIIRGSGVDLTKYQVHPEPQQVPVVVLLARLLIDKGVLEFVEAARLLKKQGVACRMVLVGDTDENPQSITASQLQQWVDQQLVEYWGYTSDVNTTYSKSNIVVLPSYREGLPKSLIEAAACGRAVITTDVPGCRDAITPNETGLLVTVKDATQLADAIATLCQNPAMRRQLGDAGRTLAEAQFDIRAVVAHHLTLYHQLLEH